MIIIILCHRICKIRKIQEIYLIHKVKRAKNILSKLTIENPEITKVDLQRKSSKFESKLKNMANLEYL